MERWRILVKLGVKGAIRSKEIMKPTSQIVPRNTRKKSKKTRM